VRSWREPETNQRTAGDWRYHADQHHGPKHPPAIAKPRAKIGDPDDAAVRIVKRRLDYGRVVDVALFRTGKFDHINRKNSALVRPQIVRQQRREDRVSIGSRQAHPHHPALPVDQCGNLTVSDNSKIQILMTLGVH
jgi:hypothetical protein